MRRRYDAVPPPELLVFEGFRYATDDDWGAAFDAFDEARERWCRSRAYPRMLCRLRWSTASARGIRAKSDGR